MRKTNWYATRITYHNEEFLLVRTEENRWILSHSDLVHWIMNGKTDTVTLEYMKDIPVGVTVSLGDAIQVEELSLDDLIELENNNPMDKSSLARWIHYFGIKDRVKRNYDMLKKSLTEMGVNPDEILPKWKYR